MFRPRSSPTPIGRCSIPVGSRAQMARSSLFALQGSKITYGSSRREWTLWLPRSWKSGQPTTGSHSACRIARNSDCESLRGKLRHACPFIPPTAIAKLAKRWRATGAEDARRAESVLRQGEGTTGHVAKAIIATNIKNTFRRCFASLHLPQGRERATAITLEGGDYRFTDLLRRFRRAPRPAVSVTPDDPAVILMSGGTTGTPKGVVGVHRGMVVAGVQLQSWLRPAMNEWTDTIMLPLPLFHTYANTGVQSLALINHNPIALIPNPREIRDVLKEIIDVKPAFICTVPTLSGDQNHRMAREEVDFTSIKRVSPEQLS